MILVYVAAPFTAPTAWQVAENVRAAERVGLELAGWGVCPVMPTAMNQSFDGTMTAEFWYRATAALLLRCDAMVLTGDWTKSKGCLRERDIARERGIPCFADTTRLKNWLASNPVREVAR